MKLPEKLFTKLFIGGLIALCVALQVALWGQRGLPDLWALRNLNVNSEIENNELMERNRVLEREIADMKAGLGAIEKEAREELGMIKQGETFFRVIQRPTRESASPELASPQGITGGDAVISD